MTLKTKIIEGKEYIFDPVRRKWMLLQPEEWVRQQFLHYLIHEKGYPVSLISVEKQLKLGQRARRYDIVVYKQDKPWMLIEVKQENEAINSSSLSQLLSYNSMLKVAYLVLINGREVHCYSLADESWSHQVPMYAFGDE